MEENDLKRIILEALHENYKKYGAKQVVAAIVNKISLNDSGYFTRTNDARANVESISPEEFKSEIISLYMEENELDDDTEISIERIARYITNHLEEKLLMMELEDAPKITGIYPENLRQAQSQMVTGLSAEIEGDIELGEDLYASTRVGFERTSQEDAVALIKDEELPNFKMMIVSDGMGGHSKGEVASAIVVKRLEEWFRGLDEKERHCYHVGVGELRYALQQKINEISDEILLSTHGSDAGATVVCAIIGENDTLIANVGDSRACKIKDGKLEQVSTDDAEVQEMYERGEIPTRDAMRFHHRSNRITDCIGFIHHNIEPHFETLSNDEYDMLLLFSDGVTDCLSEDEIVAICKESNREDVAKKLTEAALENISEAPEEVKEDYNFENYIHGGKDNTTSAVYVPEHTADEAKEYAQTQSKIEEKFKEYEQTQSTSKENQERG